MMRSRATTGQREPRSRPAFGIVFLMSGLLLLVLGCVAEPRRDSSDYLRKQIAAQTDSRLANDIEVPFAISESIRDEVDAKLKPVGDARVRVARIIDYVFRGLDLNYQLTPTRDASGTYISREGNCLSFVNLFVALGRHMRLSPFYVEVEDYQRWDHRQGMVVSQGHIVAGMFIDGEMKTYDFLPYRSKSYRDFLAIDDLTATAHYYNNLGAEALLAGDALAAHRFLEIATRVDPTFVKAANNLGVWYARERRHDEAITTFNRALAVEPDNVPLLTNLARAYQVTGRNEEAETVLSPVEGVEHTNPFFFVYKGEAALARGEHREALAYMRDALRADTETPEVHVGLTKVYVALGDLDKASHHLQRALRLDATHPEANQLAFMLQASSADAKAKAGANARGNDR